MISGHAHEGMRLVKRRTEGAYRSLGPSNQLVEMHVEDHARA